MKKMASNDNNKRKTWNKKSKAILHGGIENAIIGMQEILEEAAFYKELEKEEKEQQEKRENKEPDR